MGEEEDRPVGMVLGACFEHVWRLIEARLDEGAAYTLYRCERCDSALRVPPGGAHPWTA